ncbi:MAG: 50S ribosomal protein L22 [Eubacteriales bacterium]|nr:50S ribosomal protein L22 [Eubacteriales bacterium]
MAKGHRSQIKKERNSVKDTRPRAKVSFARVSPTKANFVLKAIRGKKVGQALGILAYNSRYGAEVISKLLRSAVANAENNNGLDVNRLYIEEAYANQGPIMKRIRPRAQGRAFRIEKKTSHITIVLNEMKDK